MLAYILLQVLVINKLHIFGGVALVYLIAILRMPVEMSRVLQIVLGFMAGVVVDMFCNTPGIHTFALTTTAYLRHRVLTFYVVADDLKTGAPSLAKLGMETFVRYALTVVVIHTLVLYLLESFTFANFWNLLVKILVSIILTMMMIMAVEVATIKK